MFPYVLLFIYIFALWFFLSTSAGNDPQSKNKRLFLGIVFFSLWVFCSIRSFTVGRDIPGYIQMYNHTAQVNWDNWDYIYFEHGYITLMKVCNIIGLSARGFFWVVYGIILFPTYLFIRRLSTNYLFSVVIYLCLQYFTFELSGIRQAIAMSLCMLALLQMIQPGKKHLIAFFVLVWLASTFHQSSLIFVFAYFLSRLRLTPTILTIYAIGFVVCWILNQMGVAMVLQYFEKDGYGFSTEDSQQLGAFLVLIAMFGICGVYGWYQMKNQEYRVIDQACTNLVLAGVCLMALFNGSTLLRACMYYYFPLIVLLPIVSKSLKPDARLAFKGCIIALLLVHFFTAEVNNLDISPYEVGEQQAITK